MSRLRKLEARDCVNRYWPEIEAVAAALLEKKTLDLKEFVSIFAGVLERAAKKRKA